MNTIKVSGVEVQIDRKDIKNLHVGVYPPDGRVRVATPLHVDDTAVRLAVISRLSWVKRQIKSFGNQPRQTEREMVTGESHYFLGKRYLLQVVMGKSKHSVTLNHNSLQLEVRSGTSTANLQKLLDSWYRQQLTLELNRLIPLWASKIEVEPNQWRIRKMVTKWGSCSMAQRNLLFNLELAKAPIESIEYIVLHELVHLKERLHNDRFTGMLDRYMPDWRERKKRLANTPLLMPSF